jgi:hypothetical protein
MRYRAHEPVPQDNSWRVRKTQKNKDKNPDRRTTSRNRSEMALTSISLATW